MKEIILKPKELPDVGLIAETIKPDLFAGKGTKEIASLEIFCGNQLKKLGDFFKISGKAADDASEIRVVIEGDISKIKMVGKGMKAGEVIIEGDVGMYVGQEMRGGKIIVEGNADSFAGQKMRGGELLIKGNAGDYLGASYRGDWRGMKGGAILVEGNAGSETGLFMVGGKITIKGNCGTFAGVHMKKGLIIIEGSTPDRAGGEMIGGSIVVMGGTELLPTFKPEKKEKNVELDGEKLKGTFQIYSGDHAERNAKGTLYILQ
jgi:formylmethanofuran dehydrogenase subunit C